MNLKVIHSEKCLYTCCMEEHEVKTVCVMENICFKNISVEYEATYFYCDAAEELFMGEVMISRNERQLPVMRVIRYRTGSMMQFSKSWIRIQNGFYTCCQKQNKK